MVREPSWYVALEQQMGREKKATEAAIHRQPWLPALQAITEAQAQAEPRAYTRETATT